LSELNELVKREYGFAADGVFEYTYWVDEVWLPGLPSIHELRADWCKCMLDKRAEPKVEMIFFKKNKKKKKAAKTDDGYMRSLMLCAGMTPDEIAAQEEAWRQS
jgi:hypothetical protein